MAEAKYTLAPTGTTGNNTHTGVAAAEVGLIGFQFVVEVAGSTPTVTYKLQGSFDGTNWSDVMLLPAGSDTATAAPAAAVGTGATLFSIAQAHSRAFSQFRLVTSANTNITYRGELYILTVAE